MATVISYSNPVTRSKEAIKEISADTTLTAADSGKIIMLDAIGEAITLPSPTAGVNFNSFVAQPQPHQTGPL